MRTNTRYTKQATITSVHGYHEGGSSWGAEDYAFAGFRENKYYTSDRYIKLTPDFTRADGKAVKGYGIEIETECTGVRNSRVLAEVLNKIIFAAFPADLFKLQRDGSLGGDSSAECITQIMTKEFVRNNYQNFKLMYDTYFPAFGIACGDNCGMHVNISNACLGKSAETQLDAVRKLYYIVNRHFELCCALFHRNPRRTTYCAKMRSDLDYCKRLDPATACSNHGVSFNLGHWTAGRIEIRLVGGQSTFACFRNTMESVFHLVDAVKKLSWNDCDDLTRIFAGCNQYVFDRLKSFCKDAGTITDEQLAKIRPTVQRAELL